VTQLALSDVQHRGYLVVIDADGHGDHAIALPVVPKPDRHSVQRGQLTHGARSIHVVTVRKSA
jgi:hypothetical protein